MIENTKCLESVELQEVVAILKSQEQRFDMHSTDATEKAFASSSIIPKRHKRGNAQSRTFKPHRKIGTKKLRNGT